MPRLPRSCSWPRSTRFRPSGKKPRAETEVEKLYESAFTALANGQYGTAYDYLGEITDRYPGTLHAALAAERKRRLDELGLHQGDRGPGDQAGRTGALVYGTLYSTWLGVGTAIVAGADSDQALAAGMMSGAPAGLLTTHLLTRDAALSPGQAALVRLGGLWGTWQGFGWTVASGDEPSDRRLTAFSMAGGLAGIAGSAALTRVADVSTGDASLLDYAGLWGTWFGFCLSVMAEADDDGVLKSSLTGGNLGLAAMAMLVPRIELNREQARLINLGGAGRHFRGQRHCRPPRPARQLRKCHGAHGHRNGGRHRRALVGFRDQAARPRIRSFRPGQCSSRMELVGPCPRDIRPRRCRQVDRRTPVASPRHPSSPSC